MTKIKCINGCGPMKKVKNKQTYKGHKIEYEAYECPVCKTTAATSKQAAELQKKILEVWKRKTNEEK